VSGDVGNDISAGKGKKITWLVHDELGDIKSDLSLRVIYVLMPPFVDVSSPQASQMFRRGKASSILWQGSNQGSIDLDLHQNGLRLRSVGNNVPNTGSYSWSLPKDMEKGKNYTIRFSDPGNPSKSVMSGQFTIGSKVPLVLKVVPIIVVGGFTIWCIQNCGDEKPPIKEDTPLIVLPPDPNDN